MIFPKIRPFHPIFYICYDDSFIMSHRKTCLVTLLLFFSLYIAFDYHIYEKAETLRVDYSFYIYTGTSKPRQWDDEDSVPKIESMNEFLKVLV